LVSATVDSPFTGQGQEARFMKRSSHRRCAVMVFAAGTVAAAALWGDPRDARADRFWADGVGKGHWSDGTNWVTTQDGTHTGGEPGSGDTAFITQGDSTNHAVELDVSDTIAGLRIGNTGSGTNSLHQSGAVTLTSTGAEYIGINVNGKGS